MAITPQQIDTDLAKLPREEQDKYLETLPTEALDAYAKFSNDLRQPTGTAHATIGGHPVIRDDADMEKMSDEELLKIATQEGLNPETGLPADMNVGQTQPQGDGGQSFLKTGLGIAGRGLVHGTTAIPSLLFDAVGGNPGETRGALDSLMDAGGMAKPTAGEDGRGERLLQAGFEGLGGFGATGGLGAGLEALGAKSVPSILKSEPALQATSNVIGSVAGQNVAENGGSAKEQILTALLAGAVPGALKTGGGAVIRGAMRGVSPNAVREVVDTFDRAGTVPTVAQATGGDKAGAVEGFLSQLFGSSGTIRKRIASQEADIGKTLDTKAENLYPELSNEKTGQMLIDHAEKGWKPTEQSKIDDLFGQYYKVFPGTTRMPVNNTLGTLDDLIATIPGAERTSRNNFLSPTRANWLGVLGDLKADIKTNLEKDGKAGIPFNAVKGLRTRLGSLMENSAFDSSIPTAEIKRLYGALSEDMKSAAQTASNVPNISVNQIGALDDAAKVVSGIKGKITSVERAKSLLEKNPDLSPEMKARYMEPHDTELATLKAQLAKENVRASGRARPLVDAMTEAGQDVSRNNLLDAATKSIGNTTKPIDAFNAANKAVQDYHGTLEMLKPILDKSGGPEKVFKAALSGMKDGGTVLRTIYSPLSPEGARALSSQILRRAAKPLAGDPEDFDMVRFAKNYGTMDKEARKVVFGSLGDGYEEDLDQISKAIRTIGKEKEEYGVATSAAQGRLGVQAAMQAPLYAIMGATGGAATGHVAAGIAAATALPAAFLGARKVANWMMNPKTVHFLAETTKLPKEQIPIAINNLAITGEKQNDPDMIELAKYLKQDQTTENDDAL